MDKSVMDESEEAVPEIDLRKRNSAVAGGVLAALLSLGMPWMTSEFDGFSVTAWNGQLFGGSLPLWSVALLAGLANLVLLARRSRHFYVPEAMPLLLALGAGGLTLFVLFAAGSEKVSLGFGWVSGFAASLVPLVYLFRERALVVAWREERRKHALELRRASARATLTGD